MKNCACASVAMLVISLLGSKALAQPMTTQPPLQTGVGPVTLTYDPNDPSSVTANVTAAKDENGNVVGTSIQMTSVNIAASSHGTGVAYCAPATSFMYCDAQMNTLLHYGPWYFFRNIAPSANLANWITQHDPPSSFGPPDPPRPDGPNSPNPGAGPFMSPIITIGIGDHGFIDSPGVNLPCPPQLDANPDDQTLTQKFTTVLYSGIPPRAYAMFKWGHMVTYNEATKMVSSTPCPLTSHLAGQQSFTDCLNMLNAHAEAAGYDEIVPVSGYPQYYRYLGPVELNLPRFGSLTFIVQIDLADPPAERRAVVRDAVRLIAQVIRGALGA